MGHSVAKRIEIKKIEWGRLSWSIFVFLYLTNFTKNLFLDIFNNKMFVPWLVCIFIFLWLSVEYYFHALFFQSSLVEPFSPFLRFLFALYFYIFVPLCIHDYYYYGKNIHTIFSLPGFAVMGYGIYIRLHSLIVQIKYRRIERILKEGFYRHSKHPRYLGLFVIIIGILASTFSLKGFVVSLFGIFVIYLHIRYEERCLIKKYGKVYKEFIEARPSFIIF